MAGEEGRVQGAEVRPVGRPHEVEFRVTERGPQHVEVAGVVQAGEVGQRGPGPARAPLGVRAGLGGLVPFEGLRGVARGLGGGLGELRRVLAGDRGGAADAARRVPDEVVRPRRPAPGRSGPERRVDHAGAARPAGVEDQRSLAFVGAAGGPAAADGEVDVAPVGAGVVERHGDRAALDVGGQFLHGRAAAEGDAARRGLPGGDGDAACLGGAVRGRDGGPAGRGGGECGEDQRSHGAVQGCCSH